MCIFLFLFLNNKDKIMSDFYLRPLWPKYILIFSFFNSFVTLKGFVFIIGKLVWLLCYFVQQNSKTNNTKNHDKIVIFLKNKNRYMIFFAYLPPYVLPKAMFGSSKRTIILKQTLKTTQKWVEAPSWSCESEGSGVILDEGMVSDLVRCSRTSSDIIGEHLELLNWQMEV